MFLSLQKGNTYQIVTLVFPPPRFRHLKCRLPRPLPLLGALFPILLLLCRGHGDRRQRSRWHIETQKIHLASRSPGQDSGTIWAEQALWSVHVSLGTTSTNITKLLQVKNFQLLKANQQHVQFSCVRVTMRETFFSNAINKLRLHILEDQPQQILSFMFLGSTPTTIGDLDEQTKTSYLLRPTTNIWSFDGVRWQHDKHYKTIIKTTFHNCEGQPKNLLSFMLLGLHQ